MSVLEVCGMTEAPAHNNDMLRAQRFMKQTKLEKYMTKDLF